MRYVLLLFFGIVANFLINADNVSQGQMRFRYRPQPQYQRYYRPSTPPMNVRYPTGYRPPVVRVAPNFGATPHQGQPNLYVRQRHLHQVATRSKGGHLY